MIFRMWINSSTRASVFRLCGHTWRNTLSLFKPPDSRYWWYSFYFEGQRHRNSTKKTTRTAAAVVEATELARLQEGRPSQVRRKKPPTLRDFSERFLEWVKDSQRLTPNGKRYYQYGWRLLSQSKLMGMRLDQIRKTLLSPLFSMRPALNRKEKNEHGKYVAAAGKEMIVCSGQLNLCFAYAEAYAKQGLRMEGDLREAPHHAGGCFRKRSPHRRTDRGSLGRSLLTADQPSSNQATARTGPAGHDHLAELWHASR